MIKTMACCFALFAFAELVGSRMVRADAPMGRYTTPAAGTVYDTRTRLTWQQNVDPNTYTWAGATMYCKDLALAGGGWRLPSVKELVTLVDVGQKSPAIDRTFFPNTPSDYFWTSSPLAGDPSFAWFVNFLNGYSSTSDVGNAFRVRCVR